RTPGGAAWAPGSVGEVARGVGQEQLEVAHRLGVVVELVDDPAPAVGDPPDLPAVVAPVLAEHRLCRGDAPLQDEPHDEGGDEEQKDEGGDHGPAAVSIT